MPGVDVLAYWANNYLENINEGYLSSCLKSIFLVKQQKRSSALTDAPPTHWICKICVPHVLGLS